MIFTRDGLTFVVYPMWVHPLWVYVECLDDVGQGYIAFGRAPRAARRLH